MEKAYNDSNGITAKFNKNILVGINKKLDAKFDADNFEHLAYFNEKKKIIEMHLIINVWKLLVFLLVNYLDKIGKKC